MKRFQLFLTALLAMSLFLVGCKEKSAAKQELNLYAWSEYVPKEVIDGFTKETGIKVNYETYASNEEMLSKLLAGATKYDLLQPSEYTVEALIKQNQIQPLDFSKIPNFKNILPEYTKMGHDPDQKYSVPWMVGTVGIVVNTDKVKDDIKSYADVFQPKFDKRIVALDDARELVTWVMYTKGMDINTVTPEALEQVKPVLATWLKLIKLYDSDSPKTALLNGDVDLGVVWSGEAAKLWSEDKKFKYILPESGAHMFVDSLVIPKDAQNKEAAQQFMNYILRPEVSVLISKGFPYTNPNGEARKLLTPDEAANPASYPAGKPTLHIFKDIGTKAGDIDKLVTDLKG